MEVACLFDYRFLMYVYQLLRHLWSDFEILIWDGTNTIVVVSLSPSQDMRDNPMDIEDILKFW